MDHISSRHIRQNLNKQGWTIGPEDKYSQSFIDESIKLAEDNEDFVSLSLGSGYGFTAQEAIEKGAKIIVNDLCSEHLEDLKERLGEKQQNVKCLSGNFLTDITIDPGSVKNVLVSRVLHMLTPKEIYQAIDLIDQWCCPGAKVHVVVSTPFSKNWKPFLSNYNENLKQNKNFPGAVEEAQFFNNQEKDMIPAKVTLFSLEDLVGCFTNHGFEIVEAGYIDRGINTDQNFPNDIRKESCGAIFLKPNIELEDLTTRYMDDVYNEFILI